MSRIVKKETPIDGCPGLVVVTFGYADPKSPEEAIEVAYSIQKNGQPIARHLLTPAELEAALAFLRTMVPPGSKL